MQFRRAVNQNNPEFHFGDLPITVQGHPFATVEVEFLLIPAVLLHLLLDGPSHISQFMFMGALPAAAVADKGMIEFIPQTHPFDANDSDDSVAFLMGLAN